MVQYSQNQGFGMGDLMIGAIMCFVTILLLGLFGSHVSGDSISDDDTPREILALDPDEYNEQSKKLVNQFTVLTKGLSVKKFFDIGTDDIIDEVWKPKPTEGWYIEYSRGAKENDMNEEYAQQLFDLVLKLTTPVSVVKEFPQASL